VDGVRDLGWRGFGDDGDVLKSPSFSRFSEGGVCFVKGFRIVMPFSKSNLLSHIRREYNTFSTEGLQALACMRSYPSLDISLSIVCVCVCRLRPWPLPLWLGTLYQSFLFSEFSLPAFPPPFAALLCPWSPMSRRCHTHPHRPPPLHCAASFSL
jgi:hypothetical protein